MAARAKPGHDAEWTAPLRHAALKPLADFFFRQMAADEDEAAVARLAVFPFALMVAVQNHVNALEHKTLWIILEIEDALAAQNILALGRHQILNPRKELVRVQRLVGLDRYRLHVLVVIVLEAAVAVSMIVAMIVMMAVVMVMLVQVLILGVEEGRLDVEDAIEVKGVATQK